MGLLDLVEQDHLVGAPPDGFSQNAAFLVADIARRGADEARDGMLLHVFRHVDSDQRPFVVEQVLGQRLGQFGFADAGRPQEHERSDRPVRILQAGARASHCRRHRPDRFLLADDALAELLFHAQQLFFLAFQHLLDRHAGPA